VDLFQIGTDKTNSKISIVGYGENSEMGSFMLDGHCEVIPCKDLVEKEGPKIEKNENQSES